MTPPDNSPKAQEVKAVKVCPFCGTNRTYLAEWDEYQKAELTIRACEIQCDCGARSPRGYGYTAKIMAIELWNRRAPNENQPPLAEKTPTTPQLSSQLSGQSEGNREKDVVKIKDAMIVEAMRCIVQMQDNVISKDEVDDIILRLGLCVAAMNSQGGKS